MSIPETITLESEPLIKNIVVMAHENDNSFDEFVNEEVKYNLLDLLENVEYVETHGGGETFTVLVGGIISGEVSVRTSRGSRHHPPEYKTEYVDIEASVAWTPAARDGIGEYHITVEQLDSSPFAEPDPEPYGL